MTRMKTSVKSQQESQPMSGLSVEGALPAQQAIPRKGLLTRIKAWPIVRRIILIAFSIWVIFPIYWMLSMSLKSNADTNAYPPKWLFIPTLNNYIFAFQRSDFTRGFLNSLLVGFSSTLLALIVGAPTAYILGRFTFRLKQNLEFWILSARMMPPIVALLPYFVFFRFLGLLDKPQALIIAHAVMNLPLVIWVLKDFFADVPPELEEAACVDGCSPWGAFVRVVLPLVSTGITATGILCFLFSWNELLFALILAGTKTKTAPLAIFNFISFEEIFWGPLAAAAVVTIIPPIIFMILVRKQLVRGLTLGALK